MMNWTGKIRDEVEGFFQSLIFCVAVVAIALLLAKFMPETSFSVQTDNHDNEWLELDMDDD